MMPDPENIRSRVLSSREARRLTYAAIARALRPVPPAPAPSSGAAFLMHEPPAGFGCRAEIMTATTRTVVIVVPAAPGGWWVTAAHGDGVGLARIGNHTPLTWDDVPAFITGQLGGGLDWSAASWDFKAHPPIPENRWLAELITSGEINLDNILNGEG